MAAIGHVSNFYHKLEQMDIKEEAFKAILKSVADSGLNYRCWTGENQETGYSVTLCILSGTVNVAIHCFINGKGFGKNYISTNLDYAMTIWPDMAKWEWKSIGIQPGFEKEL